MPSEKRVERLGLRAKRRRGARLGGGASSVFRSSEAIWEHPVMREEQTRRSVSRGHPALRAGWPLAGPAPAAQ